MGRSGRGLFNGRGQLRSGVAELVLRLANCRRMSPSSAISGARLSALGRTGAAIAAVACRTLSSWRIDRVRSPSCPDLLFQKVIREVFALFRFLTLAGCLLAERFDLGECLGQSLLLMLEKLAATAAFLGCSASCCCPARAVYGGLLQLVALFHQLIAELFNVAIEILDEMIEGKTFFAKLCGGLSEKAQEAQRRFDSMRLKTRAILSRRGADA